MKKALTLLSIFFLVVLISPECIEGSLQVDTRRGIASWYSEADPGILKSTANMEEFDDEMLTCAMWDIPFNTQVKVTNLSNGKSIIVRVNDRGPAKRLVREGRVIDLTKRAFSDIADLDEGLIPVEVTLIPIIN